ncbi:MAG: BREX-2 system adenine-specific DNA-methyltransferase PglX [Acidobacteria bacterium]|nr:MAG: BREX-2 system adenine-specific DNA-methyltransferase PglX [Acidobacteriota bacterium]REK10054.1 MAG: BREX-2 system adenine-specific DNA-methyltransferase PglX [Acidobacteriota bacterium]
MIDSAALLQRLQKQLPKLEADLLERCSPSKHPAGSPERETAESLEAALREEHRAARDADRTAAAFAAWRTEQLTQAAVAWLLACVFVRFLEDNLLLDHSPAGLRDGDNRLDYAPWLAGPSGSGSGDSDSSDPSAPTTNRFALAEEQRREYFRRHPAHSERHYLLFVLDRIKTLPGLERLFGEHNPLWRLQPSGDAAKRLLELFRDRDPESGALRFDFTDEALDTRFLGDLYQDLSEKARKQYALLQTPGFVEEFLLDRTLEPAIERFGHDRVSLIDPACGSGHFLLGAFRRLCNRRLEHAPGATREGIAQDALLQVCGVDLNPFAVAIARFRLLLAALRFAGTERLRSAARFETRVATGDSLLHGRSFRRGSPAYVQQGITAELDPLSHYLESEDPEILADVLGRQHHVVVGNPPYITGKDAKVRQEYRERYHSCHGKFSLAVPFTERFFELALSAGFERAEGDDEPSEVDPRQAGCVGMITANSFMKREFGKKLIEQFFAHVDLTAVIDTSGAYIPGHGTPTVILVGRNRAPLSDSVRAVLGIRGEPSSPEDPEKGIVWTAIAEHFDRPGYEGEYISVADRERGVFTSHPWSLQGGAAPEVLAVLQKASPHPISDVTRDIGVGVVTAEDDLFAQPASKWARAGLDAAYARVFVEGEVLRDYLIETDTKAFFPYHGEQTLSELADRLLPQLWPWKTNLRNRVWFKKTQDERGLRWYEYGHISWAKFRTPLSITFAFVATHNHFVLDRGGKVFKQSAPVIKLSEEASEDDHLALLGVLNSSTACFWCRQNMHNKGNSVDNKGARQTAAPFEDFYEFAGTRLKPFPLPNDFPSLRARQLDALATALQHHSPEHLAEHAGPSGAELTAEALHQHRKTSERLRGSMVFLQEELDWWCYAAYGLLPAEAVIAELLHVPAALRDAPQDDRQLTHLDGSWFDLPEIAQSESAGTLEAVPLALGQRAFEIALARQVERGEARTAWFERHRSKPITELPAAWPEGYRVVVERRLALIEEGGDRFVQLLERPEHKRRWASEPWKKRQKGALRSWLLERLEDRDLWPAPDPGSGALPQLLTAAQLTQRLVSGETLSGTEASGGPGSGAPASGTERSVAFRRVAALYAGREDLDLEKLVAELCSAEAVPAAAVLRYKPSGLAKHAQWQHTWELQRREDAGQEVGEIPVPPKYKSSDFNAGVWRHRGKLDVPKERFVSFPGSRRALDDSPLLAWAGWDHHQLALSLIAEIQRQSQEGSPETSILPLLVALHEQLPWVAQWHDQRNPTTGLLLSESYRGFVEDEARKLGKTVAELEQWSP